MILHMKSFAVSFVSELVSLATRHFGFVGAAATVLWGYLEQ